jgi:hypothetical protein
LNVVWVSAMPVSPKTGGGHTAFNLLEPAPEDSDVRYVTLRGAADREPLFRDIQRRAIWVPRCDVPDVNALLYRIPGGERFRQWRAKHRTSWTESTVIKSLRAFEKEKKRGRIDCILLSPQGEIEVSLAVAKQADCPVIAWFMDDYCDSDSDLIALRTLLSVCNKIFVISGAMKDDFRNRFGVDSEVLNNSIQFPADRPVISRNAEAPLRLVYSGSINSYYIDVFRFVLTALQGIPQIASLEVFTSSKVSGDFVELHPEITFHPALEAEALRSKLPFYDAVLLLSSFEERHKRLASTSQASKIADYLSAGVPIFAVGAPYAQNVRYVEQNCLGVCVKEKCAAVLIAELRRLKSDFKLRNTMGQVAFHFGQRHHDRTKNYSVLWQAIRDAAASK